jgi:hypothetical protein
MSSALISNAARRMLVAPIRLQTQAALYHSRAHPKPRAVVSVHSAIKDVLDGIEERKEAREVKWVRRADQRVKKGIKVRSSSCC